MAQARDRHHRNDDRRSEGQKRAPFDKFAEQGGRFRRVGIVAEFKNRRHRREQRRNGVELQRDEQHGRKPQRLEEIGRMLLEIGERRPERLHYGKSHRQSPLPRAPYERCDAKAKSATPRRTR